jgi:hypothetical protein
MPFQKGKSGNPAGRPRKGDSAAEIVRERWNPKNRRQAIAALADKARKGDAKALSHLVKLAGRQEREAVAEAADLTAARVLEELRRLAFVDIRGLFDDRGNLKPIQDLTPEQGSALSSVEVIIKNAKAGDGATDEIHKIKLWDKTRSLDTLAKHFGLLKEDVQVTGDIVVRWADG